MEPPSITDHQEQHSTGSYTRTIFPGAGHCVLQRRRTPSTKPYKRYFGLHHRSI